MKKLSEVSKTEHPKLTVPNAYQKCHHNIQMKCSMIHQSSLASASDVSISSSCCHHYSLNLSVCISVVFRERAAGSFRHQLSGEPGRHERRQVQRTHLGAHRRTAADHLQRNRATQVRNRFYIVLALYEVEDRHLPHFSMSFSVSAKLWSF